MFKKYRIGLALFLLGVLFCLLPDVQAWAGEGGKATVLFTHDLHSHLLPAVDESGQSYGGYARLKTAIDEQRELHPDAILVDGGDFSMGSLFQTVFATDAAELRVMGALGYDATTFGNHEYDYRAKGLARMLHAAVDSGEPLPAILESNYQPPLPGEEGYDEDSEAVWSALERYGVNDEYLVIDRGGIHYAVFGVMGVDSHACAPMSGMILEDAASEAQRIVDLIEAEVPEPCLVVCLSHSGTSTDPKESEDEILASRVDGIDVIVSGHTHTTLTEPIEVEDTYIVSCGEYSKNLGVLTLNRVGNEFTISDYELIPIDDSLKEDPTIADKVEEYKGLVEKSYLSKFGNLTFDQVVAVNPYEFGSAADLNIHQESPLGNLIADSYRWAVKEAEGENYVPVDFALTANGVIRESLATGELTVSDVYNVSSLGIGADEIPGYPLVSVWITGKDLKNAFEVDASVTGLMAAAQLYYTGMEFTFNPNRMLFNKVTDCAQVLEDGTRLEIEDEKLYRVVTGLYCGQMLGAVNDQSFGILTITPRDKEGNEITDLEAYIVHDQDGNEIKEWHALVSYLMDMGTVSERYSAREGRKISEPSWNPVHLLSNANWITWLVFTVILLILLLVVLLVRMIARRMSRRNQK